jgi:hypothetical protein
MAIEERTKRTPTYNPALAALDEISLTVSIYIAAFIFATLYTE